MTLLATYVQISDLHIGEPDDASGDARTTADLRRLAATNGWFHGSLGHHLRGLQHLEDFLEDLRAAGEPFECIVTGDLTRCGHADELQLAQQYLSGYVPLPKTQPLPTGLNLGAVPDNRVAGNHDHWGGQNLVSSTAASLYRSHALQPVGDYPRLVDGPVVRGRKLVFIGIDSDMDVKPGSWRRLVAQGAFDSQMQALAALPANPGDELRVVVIHHARQVTGTVLRMSASSRQALDDFIARAGVSVVLSGHTHKAWTRRVAKTPEFCSASTTQMDTFPGGWRNVFNAPPTSQLEPNGLLVHRLHDRSGALEWHVHVMSRKPSGFKQADVRLFVV